MAINIKNYVDISTTFPSANVANRSFGGLAFTYKDCIKPDDETSSLYKDAYCPLMGVDEPLGAAFLTLDEVRLLFGETSEEYNFARSYYSYISPSGRFASRLLFARVGDEDPIEAFQRINKVTNLFGSFTFLTGAADLGSSSSAEGYLAKLRAVARENHKLDAKYLFVVNMPASETYTYDSAINDCKYFKEKVGNENMRGTCFVYGGTSWSAFMPMAILGSTDYTNGQVVNFMFKQFDAAEEPVTIDDDEGYTRCNQAYVNFYGQSQTNGATLNFYQRGFNTDGTDTAVYCNEMWFKSICETALMQLLMSRERLPADALGVDLAKLEVIDCCADAIRNGMFMQKEVEASDVRTIREIVVGTGGVETDVGSIEADISTKGYSVYAYLTTVDNTDKLGPEPEKAIVYYVFYGTADSVRYIKGNDLLLK